MAEAHRDEVAAPLLEVQDLVKHFVVRREGLAGGRAHVRAVDGVSFRVEAGETLGLVGESGCGKSTVGKTIVRLHAPTAGRILVKGRDVAHLGHGALRPVRRTVQMVFQDPYSSLDPRMRAGAIVGEPLRTHGIARGRALRERVEALFARVGLRPEQARNFPHQFSGGQRQRLGIARALALNPALVVADEPVSALDVSVQAQIVNLLLDLQDRLGLSYLFVAHDLSVVKHVSDRVAVMYLGKIVELAPTAELFARPRHPYTEALLSAVPVPDPRRRRQRIVPRGEVADPSNPPAGCHFHPRCAYAIERCRSETPALRALADGRLARCHRAEELALAGVQAGELGQPSAAPAPARH